MSPRHRRMKNARSPKVAARVMKKAKALLFPLIDEAHRQALEDPSVTHHGAEVFIRNVINEWAPKERRRLGTNQLELLCCLIEHGGPWAGAWHTRRGWVWSTDSLTASILDSLIKHKLVTKQEEVLFKYDDKTDYRETVWRITEEGRRIAESHRTHRRPGWGRK